MARSIWKGPYVHPSLIKKIIRMMKSGVNQEIKTWSRSSTIIPEFVGFVFHVYNGKTFIKVSVNEDMVGHKLGEFAQTRIFRGHAGNNKAKRG
jgi:small subunit ribosomal protein S19